MTEGQLASSPIVIRIDRGISQFNHDYYAALGVPITADVNLIRHMYIDIAKILHPDVYGRPLQEKEIATQYLAKMVNPAYDILMQEREREAYRAIFKLLAKRLMQKVRNIGIKSAIAKQLLLNPNEAAYEKFVFAVADRQYKSLDKILEYTAQLSELNLVYILYREGYRFSDPDFSSVLTYANPKNRVSDSSNSDDDQTIFQTGDETIVQTSPIKPPAKEKTTSQISQAKPPANAQTKQSTYNQNLSRTYSPPPQPASNQDETFIQSREQFPLNPQSDVSFATRVAMAEEYMSQKQWLQALRELRIAIQLNNQDSKCMAMLGVVYKNINQPSMAKVSFQQALKLNPKEPLALQYMSSLNKGSTTNSKTEPKKADAPKGWFFGLLGLRTPDRKDRK
ncbi:DnaJ domain-containing protein [Tumidithrix elongata RA019]|uniref:DnaJ domain-containing protein n=1 Tax=Tumidithrix elongata BACA0141 TaxID=2716417 RepID=A0AAW9PS74_9CYAN|nr:DnaJ domain-containing protein [Tumidithrix elongata RA019]